MNKWDQRFLQLAQFVSTWSKDPSTKVGAVITKGKNIKSVGFNGFPEAMEDRDEWYTNRDEKYSRIIHGEMNAYLYSGKKKLKKCTLYTYPFITCDRCFVFMASTGIKRVVAPLPTTEQETRWGTAFNKVRSYAKEMNISLEEYSMEEIFGQPGGQMTIVGGNGGISMFEKIEFKA